MKPRSRPGRIATAAVAPVGSELVVRLAGEGALPQRLGGRAANRVVQLTTLLGELVAADAAIDRLAFRKSLEARADATVKALAVARRSG